MEKSDDRYVRAMETRARMDDAAREAICRQRLAGASVRALAVEHRVSESSIYRWSAQFELRLKDCPDAVPPVKGPVPVVVTLGRSAAGGAVAEARCGEQRAAVPFDPDDAVGTARRLVLECGRVFVENGPPAALTTARMGHGVMGLIREHGRLVAQELALQAAKRASRVAKRREKRRRRALERGEDLSGLKLRRAQRAPKGDWRTWLFLGGRGAGKTLAGANWLADQADRLGEGGRLALIGPTLHDVREVMIEGASGVRNLPRWTDETRPVFEPSRRRVRFHGGCEAYTFSAEEPDRLRGPQFAGAWADEFCAWPKGEETLALLRMGLRLGAAPKLMVSTTPRPTRALIGLRGEASCVQTHAGTQENAAHLAEGFVEGLRALYGGTRREAQELEGRVVDLDGALFTAEMMAQARGEGSGARDEGRMEAEGGGGASPLDPRPSTLDRIVVAIDPTATLGGDACGIVAAGVRRGADGRREAVVLADRSARGLSPDGWARRALALAAEVGAGAIVAEVNQGGDMVAQVLKAAGCQLQVREVRATRGKRIRAEPVAALYEQGRVKHAGTFGPLEEELMALGAESEAAGSLDRADALVWAITDLLIDGPDGMLGPRMRWV